MNMFSSHKNNKGQTLVILLLYMVVAIMITSASIMMILINSRAADSLSQGATALDVAESGAETAMIKLLRDPAYAGETLTVSGGQAIITISGTNPKVVRSKGVLNNFTRTIQVTADTSNNTLTVTSWKEI